MSQAGYINWMGGFPGFVGVTLMISGVASVFFSNVPTAASMFFVGLGALFVLISCLGSQIKRIELPGSRIELRESMDPIELSQGIEQLRGDKPDPAEAKPPAEDWWEPARYMVGEKALAGLLDRLNGPLYGCQARVFLYDETEGMLMPVYRPPGTTGQPQGWRVGEGVIGAAFQYNEYTYVDANSIRDDRWGLEESTLDRYRELTAVAATALYMRDGVVVGVLALSDKGPATKLTSPAGQAAHLALAQQVSVCLVDLLLGGG